MSTKKALLWIIIWGELALLFNIIIFLLLGRESALEFLGGYVIEQSLIIDNLFLFIMVFSSYGIKPENQRRVLNYGIAGAIILRLIFVVMGITLINLFHWMLYLFGAALMISGSKMMFTRKREFNYKDSKIIKLISKIIPITDHPVGDKFFVKEQGTLYATPLFVIIILIELTDILFAIDSIPAIFSVTMDPFIVYSSNIFAILGLRNMYFLLSKLQEKFQYVKYGVALILVFTGLKLELLILHIEIPIEWSLSIILAVIGVSVIASVAFTKRE